MDCVALRDVVDVRFELTRELPESDLFAGVARVRLRVTFASEMPPREHTSRTRIASKLALFWMTYKDEIAEISRLRDFCRGYVGRDSIGG
jgi:hypothetical protein